MLNEQTWVDREDFFRSFAGIFGKRSKISTILSSSSMLLLDVAMETPSVFQPGNFCSRPSATNKNVVLVVGMRL